MCHLQLICLLFSVGVTSIYLQDNCNFIYCGYLQSNNDEVTPIRIYVVDSAKALEKLRETSKAVVIADAPWSVHSTLSRRSLFSLAFKRRVERTTPDQIAYFIVTEDFFDEFALFLADKEIVYDHGARERGAYLLWTRTKAKVVDPKQGMAADILEEEVNDYWKFTRGRE